MTANKKVRILLVEDNDNDVFLVKAALDAASIACDIEIERDGAEGLSLMSRIGRGEIPCPDLLLLDLNLPKVTGDRILREARQNPLSANLPIIVMSSSGAYREMATVVQLGIWHYFRKPNSMEEYMMLGPIVRDAIRHSASNKPS